MCVIRCYTVKDGLEKMDQYSWNLDRKVTKALLKKSKALRFEIWVPSDLKDEMIEKGWFPAKRSDGSEIISEKGNQLFTFPKRELKPFPF